MSSDLGLDPSDPLNLLLHNTSQCSNTSSGNSSMEDSSQDGSPPDWSQLSSLWPSHLDGSHVVDEGKYPDVIDFDPSSFPVDIDFNPSMSIEPSALHFDPTKFSYNYDSYSLSNEVSSTQFPFTFSPNPTPLNADSTQLQQAFVVVSVSGPPKEIQHYQTR